MDFAVTLIFGVLLVWMTVRLPFLKNSGIPLKRRVFYFLIKLLAALTLYIIYTRFYTDRSTADLFKYFDDSRYLWEVAGKDPVLFIKMMLGLHGDDPEAYYVFSEMNNWFARDSTFSYNNGHGLIRLNAFLRIFSFGVIHVHNFILAFAGFVALTSIYRLVKDLIPGREYFIEILLFMLPSLLLWTSGALKETVVICGLGALAQGMRTLKHKGLWPWVWLLSGVIIVAAAKVYLLVAILPATGAWLLAYIFQIKSTLRIIAVYFSVLIVSMAGMYGMGRYSAEYVLPEVIHARQTDFVNVANGGVYLENDKILAYIPDDERSALTCSGDTCIIEKGYTYVYWIRFGNGDTLTTESSGTDTLLNIYDNVRSGSLITPPELGEGWAGLLVASPHAFINTAIAPLQKKPDNVMQLMAFAETSLLLILIIVGLYFSRKTKPVVQISGINFLLFTILFTGILFVLVGWITPVTGALVRYKVPALPLLAVCICMLFTFDPIKKIIEKLGFY